MMRKSIVQSIDGGFVGVGVVGGLFSKAFSELNNLPDSLNGLKQTILVSSPELALCSRLPDTDRASVDKDVFTLIEKLKLDLSKLTVHISSVDVGKDKQQETLLVIARQDKLNNVLAEFSVYNCKVAGFLPEQLAIHRIVEAEITPEETQLILHIGEKSTSLYLLDKYGPVKTYPAPIINEELIPTVQKFIKGQEYCRQGVYFGKRSLSFDQKLFEEQTKVRLNDGVKSLQRFAQNKKQNISNIRDLHEHVPVLGAALGFKKKELLDLNYKPEKRIKIRFTQISLPWKEILLGLIAAGVTALLVTGGVLFLKREPSDTVSVSNPIVFPTPTPEPIISVKAGDIKVRVLNGSGTPGEAGRYAVIFEDAGFEVVEVGNASVFDYNTTEVRHKENKDAELKLVLDQLEEKVTSKDFLDGDDKADIEIIVGGS